MSSSSCAVWIFRWPQPSVTVGMPWAVSQLASRPPLVTASSGSWPFGLDRRRGRDDARLVALQAKRFVVEPALESSRGRICRPCCALPAAARSNAASISFTIRSRNFGSWLRASARMLHVVGHDVRRLAALDDADVARAGVPSFCDQSVPAVLHQVGDGERRDGDRADALLRAIAGVAGEAVDFDRHAIAARRADRRASPASRRRS